MANLGLQNGRRRAVVTLVAIVALAVVAAFPVVSAYAKSVPSSVRTAARAVVAKVGQQTHATSTKVLGCRRSTSSRYFCQVQNTFRTGASRCVADVRVTLAKRGGRPRAKITNYVCY
jgi:hypothetical protein